MNTKVNSRTPYEVVAYDKDNDVYVTMHTTPSEALALRIAKSLKKLKPYALIAVYQGENVRAAF